MIENSFVTSRSYWRLLHQIRGNKPRRKKEKGRQQN
jgi:hypothetical protein